jgi:hypothetical protein
MQAPARVVFDLIDNFREWRKWSPWEDLDPNLHRTYAGPEAGVGAVYEWAGNRTAGAGRMEITKAEGSSRVELVLQFLKPFKATSTTTFDIDESGGNTRVTWRMVGPKTFLTRLMGVFMSMDKMVGPDFEKGLAQLATAAQA